MRYSRGRIIALAILSVTMAFALFCTGYVFDWRNSLSRAANNGVTNNNEIPDFDDLYQRIPFDKADTGSVVLGKNTKLTLIEERYNSGTLTTFLNATTKNSYSEFQTKRSEGYPYPIFTNSEMRSIANGLGNSLNVPVVMLDPYVHDDIVLFELTGLVSAPEQLSIVRDGNSLSAAICQVDPMLDSDYVYAGIPDGMLKAMTEPIQDANGDEILNVTFNPTTSVSEGYVVEIRDANGDYLYLLNQSTMALEQIEKIENGSTELYDSNGILKYRIERRNEQVDVYDATQNPQVQLGTVIYDKNENQLINYQIGAVAWNGNAVRGMFQEEGFYQISFKQKVASGEGIVSEVNVSFAFIIVNKMNYTDFPRFDTQHRALGNAEIYNYSYDGEYPKVEYSSSAFDVQIHTDEKYNENDPINDERELSFYNIGEYKMVSSLQCYNAYLAGREEFSKRGVSNGFVKLNRYTQYSSVLNIYGFQAYFGGQHANSEFNGPLPFFGSEYGSESSDISTFVKDREMTAGEIGFDYQTMNVSDALNYSDQLANYLTTHKVKPVRTNFPPVRIKGNVLHATGAGMNGENAVVLSSVAFKPAYGMTDVNDWQNSTLEVGAPFEEAGQYLVTVYFKVNTTICQQNFFFEIVNSAKIAFEFTDGLGEKKTYYAGELELNNDFSINGNKIKLSYDGDTTLGQYEVPPIITLDYARLGSLNYVDMQIPMQEAGAFEFSLQAGQYRLTVEYGAHNKSASVFDIVVDNTKATGMKINTTANSLPGMPENLAVVGVGEASLTWNHKVSGINFNNVLCEFYEMKMEYTSSDPNVDRNYFEPTEISLSRLSNLYSAYAFVKDPSIPNNGYVPVKTESGWTLNETFNTPGLYNFTIIDEVGNETQFVLIIDNSTPTFVQSGKKTSTVSNAVNFDENGVYVGFGTRKLVTGQMFEKFATMLTDAGILMNDARQVAGSGRQQTAFNVGLASVECSRSGTQYQKLSKEDIARGYTILKEEDTYYFRVTDVLGNVGEYYIILTHDNCIGTVYAESIRPTISTTNEDKTRGFVTATPTINTSLVNNKGGMTNRAFVTFSFLQKGEFQQFCVDKVYLQYYPLTYQTKSSFDSTKKNENYPFADKPENNPQGSNGPIFANQASKQGIIYSYCSGDEAKGTIRLSLFNHNTTTPAGLYIITRIYKNTGANDTYARDYHFIVDNQKMLYYNADGSNPYQTALKVKFANQRSDSIAKTALAKDIYAFNNELSSNRTAWLSGCVSKYSCEHNSTTYAFTQKNSNYLAGFTDNTLKAYQYNFPSLTPRFSYVHDNQVFDLGEGSGVWSIGDASSESNLYKVLIRDDARNMSCMLVNGNCAELMDDPNAPTSANFDYLTLNLDLKNTAKAELEIGNNKVITNAGMQFDGAGYTYIVDPEDISELKFSFESDPNSMYMNILVPETTASWDANGFSKTINFGVPTPVDYKYTYDLMNGFLSGVAIENGSSLSVNLLGQDGTTTKYTVLFDTVNPSYNLERVKAGDNLACNLSMSELPGNYIYGLSNDFVFESDQVNNYYLDTQTITYREVNYSGEGTQAAVQFDLYTGGENESRIPFTQIIGLRDNEMKYYMITEVDYAGNSTDYLIQVQGEKYVNNINFIGAITDSNDEIQIGCEMHASTSSVHQFFVNNNSFKFESGEDHYTVLGSTASWRIGNDVGTGAKSEKNLINALNNWINVATENGTKCAYTLYDRIGEKEVFEFFNIRENAAKIQLDCFQASAGSSVIMTSVTNYDELPKILFDERLASLFKMTIKDNTAEDIETEVLFNLEGTPIQGFDVSHELIITVTDPFGRVSTTEYHQQRSSSLIFTVNGNTVTQDGVIYVGDKRGVNFSYLRTAYNVLIYDAGTGEVLTNLQPFISNDMINYTFVPKPEGTTLEQYRIVATGRASGSVLFDKTFVFDTRLPSVEWKNASDQTIQVDGLTFVSDVCFDISKSMIPTSFPVTVSYVREYNGKIERVTLKPGVDKFTFEEPGNYSVTLRNTVWAEKTYTFKIEQINDNLMLVYDDGKQLTTSPSEYKFTPNKNKPNEFSYIPRYVFTTNGKGDSIAQYQAHGLEIKIGQTNRVLAGNADLNTDYYFFDDVNNTIVWRLAFLLGESDGVKIYDNPIYFATTGVASGELNTGNGDSVDSPITLQLNGNPNKVNINTKNFLVTPSLTTYHFIDDSFMLAHDQKVEVRLFCAANVLRDEKNMPYYMTEGNVIVVDCYYNGQLIKTLYGDGEEQVFTISRYDAGYYEFVVHDLVGNYLYFGNSSNKNDVNYRQERYMLVVMTKPMILINDKQPVNGMIYNDKVELKLVDYGNKFLAKLYADQLAEDELFFTKRFCISKVEVLYTGSNGQNETVLNVNGRQSSFYWSNSGNYRVKVTYQISDNIIDDLTAEYQFQIIPAQTTRESFSMPIYPDIQVVSVTRNGYIIHDFDNLKVNQNMEFSADRNPGSYVVTLKTYNSIVGQYVTHQVKFNIQVKANSASNYFVLSSGSGTSTVGEVTIYYNPYWLYHSQGKMTIYLYKNNQEQQKVIVDQTAYINSNYNTQELFTVKDAGLYTVIAKDADGDPVYMDSWTVEAKQSTFGYIILAVVLGIGGIGVLIFIRMRNKMSTK